MNDQVESNPDCGASGFFGDPEHGYLQEWPASRKRSAADDHWDTEGRFSIAAGKAMRQNKTTWFRAEAMADLWATFKPKGSDCSLGKYGSGEPSFRSAHAPVCGFSILACLQELVRRCAIVGWPIQPILCAGLSAGVPRDVRWAAAEEAGCAW
jgi:hypothetical protein